MELGSVVEFLENKIVLVSGVTGFVAKGILKILKGKSRISLLFKWTFLKFFG